MTETFIFLQSAGNPLTSFLPMVLVMVVIWFFMIRPQAKRQKEQANFVTQMEKGQEVVTSSGIIGKINKIEDNVVTLEIGSKNYVRILKSAVSKDMTEGLYGKEKKQGPVEENG